MLQRAQPLVSQVTTFSSKMLIAMRPLVKRGSDMSLATQARLQHLLQQQQQAAWLSSVTGLMNSSNDRLLLTWRKCQPAVGGLLQQKRNLNGEPGTEKPADEQQMEQQMVVRSKTVIYEESTEQKVLIQMGGTSMMVLLVGNYLTNIWAFDPVMLPTLVVTPYLLKQCHLWTVDRPLKITVDRENKRCILDFWGNYKLPVWNTCTYTKAEMRRVPNQVCAHAAEVKRKSWWRVREDNVITVFPADSKKERQFIIDPKCLVKSPTVYNYFFCTQDNCVNKEDDAITCDAKPAAL